MFYLLFSRSSASLPDTETLEHLARDYGVDEVGEFFTEVGLGQYTEAFQEALISGEELLEADKEFLEELGVKSAIDRLKMKELFRRKLQGAKVKWVHNTTLCTTEVIMTLCITFPGSLWQTWWTSCSRTNWTSTLLPSNSTPSMETFCWQLTITC